jgi:hypothetical protein
MQRQDQAKLLLDLFNDGHIMEEMLPNKIVLGWKACRLLSASVWVPPPLSGALIAARAVVPVIRGDVARSARVLAGWNSITLTLSPSNLLTR